jgi:Prophage protein (DUF1660)
LQAVPGGIQMLKLVCRLVGHRRSAFRAHRTADGWQSRCKRCHVNLVRVGPRKWEVASDDDAPTDARFTEQVLFTPTNTPLQTRGPA